MPRPDASLAVIHNLWAEMRVTIILTLTFLYVTALGQRSAQKYQDYFGHTLVLNSDSTFRFDWRSDSILLHDWASGRWSISGRIIKLKFITFYDTLSRPGKPDTLVLSNDEKANKIFGREYLEIGIVDEQNKDRFVDVFYQRGRRLFPSEKNGQLVKSRQRGIWPKKNKWKYETRPTFYKKKINSKRCTTVCLCHLRVTS